MIFPFESDSVSTIPDVTFHVVKIGTVDEAIDAEDFSGEVRLPVASDVTCVATPLIVRVCVAFAVDPVTIIRVPSLEIIMFRHLKASTRELST